MTHQNLWGVMRVFFIPKDSETGPNNMFLKYPYLNCPRRSWEKKHILLAAILHTFRLAAVSYCSHYVQETEQEQQNTKGP